MLSDNDVRDLIKELEEGMKTSREEDQFGYAKIRACEVYKKVIKRLKEMNKNGLSFKKGEKDK